MINASMRYSEREKMAHVISSSRNEILGIRLKVEGYLENSSNPNVIVDLIQNLMVRTFFLFILLIY